jgi:hypothetical protein
MVTRPIPSSNSTEVRWYGVQYGLQPSGPIQRRLLHGMYSISSVHRSSPWDQKKILKLDWTGLIRTGPVVYLWTSLFQSSCWLPGFKNIIGPMKNQFKSVSTSLLWKPLLDHVPTLISINSYPWTIKNGQELVKIWQKSFLHKYFVMIRMTLITLLITCVNILGTPGYHPRHINNTLNHVYNVYFICSTPRQVTTTCKLQTWSHDWTGPSNVLSFWP